MTDTCECTCGRIGCASRRGKGDLVHGSTFTYGLGCRCDECVRANTQKTIELRRRVNADTRDSATHHAQEWTSAQLEIIMRPGLTAREAGALVGRTMQAVKNARFKCLHDPVYIEKLRSSDYAH